MRAYALVKNHAATVHVPATSNRCAMQIERSAFGKDDGWYRAQATYDEGWGGWSVEIGKKIDPAKEAVRLRALARKGENKEARTGSPGISGYMHMERMATEAIRIQVQVSDYFADMLGAFAGE